ncbi:hypothetical protein TSMEX_008268, partial [Taenia solium]
VGDLEIPQNLRRMQLMKLVPNVFKIFSLHIDTILFLLDLYKFQG